MRYFFLAIAALCFTVSAQAQALQQTKGSFEDKFRQLDEDLPTPTETRLASGAPGPDYWQQQVDYDIKVRLNEKARRIIGQETVRYTNNSPHTLDYLWLQLDQNRFKADSMSNLTRSDGADERISYYAIRRAKALETFKGGYDLRNVKSEGEDLHYAIIDTNMRIDLPAPLEPGETVEFSLNFAYNIYDNKVIGGRGGYECFEKKDEDGNCIFQISQWYPRLHAYSDYEGWHNKAFLGSGEFTLEFGDYHVEITVPEDHIVASTGVLQNESDVLTGPQLKRLDNARKSDEPVFIVTPSEARAAQNAVASGAQTWVFDAENVRDFSWASSRKFIWDAMNVEQNDYSDGADVLAMSYYPNEGEPLWSAYSTKSIAHTIKVYSRYSFAYPYPIAQSVNGPVGGMEYPMITFNGPRPVKDDDGNITYSRRSKYGLISVVIHEIGHTYFPMTVNSDERQWTWMDEGLNTFLQFLAESEWEENYPSRRGEPKNIVSYMVSQNQVPIMTQSDSILQFGNNAYGKPATALVILRETILGREEFDHAFREYAQRWKFKRPTPSDFFRTMEEASGTDLDWFWRGWFYSTDHVDISIDSIVKGTLNTRDPDEVAAAAREKRDDEPLSLTQERNKDFPKAVEGDDELLDFYNEYDEHTPAANAKEAYEKELERLEPWEREALLIKDNFYTLTFTNHGGLVMPIIFEITYASGRKEMVRIPAEIWRKNPHQVSKLIVTEGEIVSVELDPRWETADVDRSNNHFPPKIEPSRLEVYKRKTMKNLMERLERKVEPDTLKTSKIEKEDKDASDD